MVPLNIPNNFDPSPYVALVVGDDYSTHLLGWENTLTSNGYQVLRSQNLEQALAMILDPETIIGIIVCGIPISNIGVLNLIRAAKCKLEVPVILMVSDRSDIATMRETMSGAAHCVIPELPFGVIKDFWQRLPRTRRNDYYSSVYSPQTESTTRKVPPFKAIRETQTKYRRGPSFLSNRNTSSVKSHHHVIPTTAYGGGLNNCYKPSLDKSHYHVPTTAYGRGLSNFSNPNTSLYKSHHHVIPTTAYGRGLNNCYNPNGSLDKSHYHVPTAAYGGGLSNCSNPNTSLGRGLKNCYNPNSSLDKSHYHVPTTSYGGRLNNCSNPNIDHSKIREENSEGLDHDLDDRHKFVFKKRRFIWTKEYHQIFSEGIVHITLQGKKVVPATLLKYMHSKGVSHVSRENVASHLQKYRMHNKKYSHGGGDFANTDVVSTDTQPSKETDDWWDTLEDIPTGLENKSTSIWPDIIDEFIDNNTIPMENSDQPPQLDDDQESK
ncbi:two-component response regulator EHD1-like [Cucumis melo var. makuwa]|uniref:Two-component response regulator EHD1-like n=1 Tax=Cucumis melo var. makuwa TaxID=1194695 RepID=A0A5D3D2Q4_CUCMM|nr:two-component response regulator EHD1-like [Cucumis melo var. makuwa]TYK18202.1 two-component response regulator EHD1-like [Cucumis melo var. makuwa]